MTICEAQVRSRYLGVKRTWLVVLHMCAFDPKRTLQLPPRLLAIGARADICVSGAAGCPI
jgi:hypothetical protein